MKKIIFLDTNNWIYLSNGFNVLSNDHDELHLKVFEQIEKRVDNGDLVFLVNEIVFQEWNRNKESTKQQVDKIRSKQSAYNAQLKAIKGFLGEMDREEVDHVAEKMNYKFEEKIKRHEEQISRVEDFLFNKTVKIEVTKTSKLEATELALSKKAPFIGDKRNSMADALILLSAVEHICENEFVGNDTFSFQTDSYFVSSNKGDFSSPEDKEKIHDDLKPYLEKSGLAFFHNLNKLMDLLEKEFLTREEFQVMEHADEEAYCGICNFDEFPSVSFSEYFDVFNPAYPSRDKNQLILEFKDAEDGVETSDVNSFIKMRVCGCSHCHTTMIECHNCDGFTPVYDYDVKFPCIGGCGNKFIVHVDQDRKGYVHGADYEIVIDYTCSSCGNEVEDVNGWGVCEVCETLGKD